MPELYKHTCLPFSSELMLVRMVRKLHTTEEDARRILKKCLSFCTAVRLLETVAIEGQSTLPHVVVDEDYRAWHDNFKTPKMSMAFITLVYVAAGTERLRRSFFPQARRIWNFQYRSY